MSTRDDSTASLLHLLHRAGQCADELFAANIGESALTPRQYEVLKAVDATEDPSQTHLVEITGIDRSTLADIVRRLVERGVLARTRTRRDARMYAVKLTSEGEAALKAAAPTVASTNARLTAGLSESDRDAVVRGLTQIIASAKSDT
ncbi:MAG: MarR family winged helix-turn-helix transcriptional regulator [Alphaproteobacteria bacterium]|nr:MarR family winged helix-turn-helix transcriptional regulator [Alphaproteobacteria bacterium]